MCLDSVDREADLSQYEGTTAYKVFKRFYSGQKLGGQFLRTREERKRGEWLDAKAFREDLVCKMDGTKETYPAGWHSFLHREDAEAYRYLPSEVVVEITIRQIKAIGYQMIESSHLCKSTLGGLPPHKSANENVGTPQSATVIVSGEMFIPEASCRDKRLARYFEA